MFQDPVPIWKVVNPLRHPMSGLDACLEKEVDQMEVTTGMGMPLLSTLHMKSNGYWRRIWARILMSQVPCSVIRGKRLVSYNVMAEGTTGEVGVVFKRHVDG